MIHDVFLLGATRIVTDAEPAAASLYRPRKVALITYLALSGRPVRRLELASVLWPDVTERRARGSLNQLLVELRRELGADVFVSRAEDEIALAPELVRCDACTLLSAAGAGKHDRALALYGGALLEGFVVAGLDAFTDWLELTRRRIDDVVVDAAWHVAAADDGTPRAVSALQLAARLRPDDEAILRRRMKLHASVYGPAAAAAMFEEHRARVAEELGISPSAETRKLLFELCSASDVAAIDIRRTDAVVPASARKRWPRASIMRESAVAASVVLCILAASLAQHARTSHKRDAERTVDVALMNFGDQASPVVRALPGLVASYLIRDTAIELAPEHVSPNAYAVSANLHEQDGGIAGTLEIRKQGAVVASTTLHTTTELGLDTIAAQLARYVSDVTTPTEPFASPSAALRAAREHLLYARADYARGVRQNAAFELERASMQLDSVAIESRDRDWRDTAEAVARERQWQQHAVTTK
jgi:DNA-binding SARP family transcriptional activator